ncbi:MAG: hypothetical protein LC104_06120 [Bacteroidales bacterium]|nr:hypothetical protein [Bacteroidales bacterium]
MIHLGVLVLLSLAVCVPPLQAALAPASCTFGNQTVAHGDSVTAYQGELAMSGQTCVSETRTCNNGTLSGSYRFDSCRVACNFNGYMILPGDNVTAYQSDSVPYDQHCESESRTCDNGTMTGSYRYDSCTVGPAPCRYRDQIVAHGRSVTTYQSDSV